MPAKKIEPEEQIRLDKMKAIKNKLLFAGVFALLVLATNFYMTRYPKQQAEVDTASYEQQPAVLGKSTKEEKERLERVQKQANDFVETVSNESSSFIETSTNKVEKTVSDIVYTTTIKPLIDRINNLSDDQQDYVREALCK